MDNTSSNLPVCVYCGTARPADESLCPNCGKPWIDVSVDESAGAAAGAAVGEETGTSEEGTPQPETTADTTEMPAVPIAAGVAATAAVGAGVGSSGMEDTGEFSFDDWTLPPERPRSKARWLIPIVLLIAVVAVWVLVFLDRGGSSPTTVALETTTTAAVTTTTTPSETTTTSGTTTTTATTTTTVPYPPPTDWAAVGDAVPVDQLTLRAEGIGPLDFGGSITNTAGALVSSLGEAEASGIDGLCPDDEAYWLQWGDLLAIFSGYTSDATFVSYRYADLGSGADLGLSTLSGLKLGDTVADLTSIYAAYTITFEVIDGKDHFRLIDGGDLLLWGPVSSTDQSGTIEGIYSPSSCAS